MATDPEFKALVMASLSVPGKGRMPGPGGVLVIGQAAGGGLMRVKIPRRYRLFDAWMVRGFIRQKKIDQLAILIGEGQPGRFHMVLVDRAGPIAQPASTDPRLASLARAASLEWSGTPPPLLGLFGRPWPITLLVVVLALDFVLGLKRMGWIFAGYEYNWLPVVSPQAATILYAAYLVIVAATVFTLSRQTWLGYALALLLAAVQFARAIVLLVPVAQSMTFGQAAWYLLLAFVFPATVLTCLVILYQARTTATA